MTIGCGLTTTLSQTSPPRLWIPYQALTGVGIGLCFQAPVMAAQALAAHADVSATTAMLLFFQTMGGAFMVSAAQSGFANVLVQKLGVYAPGVEPRAVLVAGATRLREVFEGEELAGVLESYMRGLRVAFAICTVAAGVATVVACGMPWVSIRRKAEGEEKDKVVMPNV